MTVRDILRMGDARLLRVAQPVPAFDTDTLHLLVRDLLETMASADGVGLAAPQIGEDWQVVVFGGTGPNPRYPDAPLIPRTVLINPSITPLAPAPNQPAQVGDWEGCLSVPGLRGWVPRWAGVRYTGWDAFGDPIDRCVSGFHARVVQHECDHLWGKLYPMRVTDWSRFGFVPEVQAGR